MRRNILDRADLILRFDGACVDACVNDKPASGKMHTGIVYERHYSLNWLTHYLDLYWDDVTTDTWYYITILNCNTYESWLLRK
ncbi:MAG: DUF4272 domain-containing protein [Sphingobacteriales bacterium]|nr:DUF4272 domain-containing protein [Sphingobacteriales bacterium]